MKRKDKEAEGRNLFLLKNLFQSIWRRETELYKEEMYVIARNKDLFQGIRVKWS